ncbi:MAG TPA: hypothetical protein VFO53_15670 [Casimicrobiaceae bacterium]|nr:hypothetical protein [Casimicrobiaceae bacterium]
MPFARWCVAAAGLIVAGCQTWGPTWSELSGARYTRINPDRAQAILVSAGDESIGSVTPFRVAPGKSRVVVQSPVHNRFRGSEKDMMLDIAPCKRYYINAQFANPVSPDWTPVVDYVETIAGCRA